LGETKEERSQYVAPECARQGPPTGAREYGADSNSGNNE